MCLFRFNAIVCHRPAEMHVFGLFTFHLLSLLCLSIHSFLAPCLLFVEWPSFFFSVNFDSRALWGLFRQMKCLKPKPKKKINEKEKQNKTQIIYLGFIFLLFPSAVRLETVQRAAQKCSRTQIRNNLLSLFIKWSSVLDICVLFKSKNEIYPFYHRLCQLNKAICECSIFRMFCIWSLLFVLRDANERTSCISSKTIVVSVWCKYSACVAQLCAVNRYRMICVQMLAALDHCTLKIKRTKQKKRS